MKTNNVTRGNKTTRVRNIIGAVAQTITPNPEPTIIGYVVRYDRGGDLKEVSSAPLWFDDRDGILYIDPQGTIFPTHDAARDACLRSIRYQNAAGYRWNEMYGDYLIDPVIAA